MLTLSSLRLLLCCFTFSGNFYFIFGYTAQQRFEPRRLNIHPSKIGQMASEIRDKWHTKNYCENVFCFWQTSKQCEMWWVSWQISKWVHDLSIFSFFQLHRRCFSEWRLSIVKTDDRHTPAAVAVRCLLNFKRKASWPSVALKFQNKSRLIGLSKLWKDHQKFWGCPSTRVMILQTREVSRSNR